MLAPLATAPAVERLPRWQSALNLCSERQARLSGGIERFFDAASGIDCGGAPRRPRAASGACLQR
jgi:hypothetical protein